MAWEWPAHPSQFLSREGGGGGGGEGGEEGEREGRREGGKRCFDIQDGYIQPL